MVDELGRVVEEMERLAAANGAPVDAPAAPRRLGFLAGEIAVPDDFDRLG